MKIPVKDICNVIGRGQIIVCEFPEEIITYTNDAWLIDIHIGDTIHIDNDEYTIKGIERWIFSKTAGLILDKHINGQPEYIEI